MRAGGANVGYEKERRSAGGRGASKLRTEGLTLAYEDTAVVWDLDVAVPAGEITSIVGPNGCGKSTLLRSLARLMRPEGGAIYLDGNVIAGLPTREVAKRLGILPEAGNADMKGPETMQ